MDLRERRERKSSSASRHPWELARLLIVRRLLNRQLSRSQPPVILDIGCGDAFVAGQLARYFPSAELLAVDIELDDAVRESLRIQLSEPRVHLCKTLEEAEREAPQAADVTLLLDVLEHIEDDVGFMQQLRASPLIADRTWFLITVPARQHLFSAHDVFLGHFRRYDNGVLEEHLSRAGYEVQESGQFFFLALLLRWLTVAKERRFTSRVKKPVGLASWRGGPWFTTLLTSLLVLDFACSRMLRCFGIRLPGLSRYALCRMSAS